MTLTIHSNGSKWYGEAPDPVEVLLDALGKHTLDPSFEDYGNFVFQEEGRWWVFGNFLERSHVFRISTEDHAEVAEVEAAIRAKQATPVYQAAREDWQRRKQGREAVTRTWCKGPVGEHTSRLSDKRDGPDKNPTQGMLF